ncbi:hypothetical protein [Solirubrum puertoriconensis]|nr:hypothetical protein [Solirubrum puertoriconensis]
MSASPQRGLAEQPTVASGNAVFRPHHRSQRRQAVHQHDYLRHDIAQGSQRLTLPLPERKLPWLPTLQPMPLLHRLLWEVLIPEVQLGVAAVPAFHRSRLLRSFVFPNAP